jgi:acyl-coenzyme A synthetase/AMP-(fatty) acid ligase
VEKKGKPKGGTAQEASNRSTVASVFSLQKTTKECRVLEIKQALYSRPDILGYAVIGKEDPKSGEIPEGIVLLTPEVKLTPQEIISFTRERRGHFKALRQAEIGDKMPPGGTGRILKRVPREMYG